MNKISEAKKSELIKREEKLDKRDNELDKRSSIINSDRKALDKIIKTSCDKLKKEQDTFDAEYRIKQKELTEEQKRLDIRSRSIASERETTKNLSIRYKNGIKDNKEIALKLGDDNRALEGREKGLESDSLKLNIRKNELDTQDKLLSKKDKGISDQLSLAKKQTSLNETESKRLEEVEESIEVKRYDVIQEKSKCRELEINNSAEEKRLSRFELKLNSRESFLRQIEKSMEVEKSKLKTIDEDLRLKGQSITIAKAGIKENSDKYYDLKNEVDSAKIKVDLLEKSLIKRETEVSKAQGVIEIDKASILKEKATLSAWDKELKTLEADLKDIQRLIKIDQRELDSKRKIVQQLRKEDK